MKNIFLHPFYYLSSFLLVSCNQSESSVQKRLSSYEVKFNPPPGTFENRDTLNIAIWVAGLTQDDTMRVDTSPPGSAKEQPCTGSNIPQSAKCFKLTSPSVLVTVQMNGLSHGKGIYGEKKEARYTLMGPTGQAPETHSSVDTPPVTPNPEPNPIKTF